MRGLLIFLVFVPLTLLASTKLQDEHRLGVQYFHQKQYWDGCLGDADAKPIIQFSPAIGGNLGGLEFVWCV